jgi:predicted amidophosphoribosyltransferase
MTEGTCPNCGKPLISGAHFCSYCKAPTPRTALVCAVCGTRNAGDAIWCGACGTPLEDEDAELVPRRRSSVSTRIATFLDSALER